QHQENSDDTRAQTDVHVGPSACERLAPGISGFQLHARRHVTPVHPRGTKFAFLPDMRKLGARARIAAEETTFAASAKDVAKSCSCSLNRRLQHNPSNSFVCRREGTPRTDSQFQPRTHA